MSTAAGSLAQDMLVAFRDQQLSDITVVAFGQTFHLHRLILLRSGYFRSLVLGQGDWIEKSRQSITIQFDDPYVTLQSFQRIIHWLYGIDFHYTEGSAPLPFKTNNAGGGRAMGLGGKASNLSNQSQWPLSSSAPIEGGRHGLGLHHGSGSAVNLAANSEKSSVSGMGTASSLRYDNIMTDPSDKVDELLISMYAAASYLNISALTEEICSDIARRIRDSRGLIHYMGYAWKLNNGRAWDIILAHCFYQFFWYTYKSTVLQDMLISPDMPIAGLVKTLVAESLWVPNEYERYQLVKGIMLRRLNLDTDKLMDWVHDYHDQDWFMVLKDLDDNGTWSDELTSDTFLANLQDWEPSSTAEYEDAVDSDHEWITTSKELRRRSSQNRASITDTWDISLLACAVCNVDHVRHISSTPGPRPAGTHVPTSPQHPLHAHVVRSAQPGPKRRIGSTITDQGCLLETTSLAANRREYIPDAAIHQYAPSRTAPWSRSDPSRATCTISGGIPEEKNAWFVTGFTGSCVLAKQFARIATHAIQHISLYQSPGSHDRRKALHDLDILWRQLVEHSGILAALRGDQHTTSAAATGQPTRRTPVIPNQQSAENICANADCSSVYSRQRELTCNYRIYMTTNVVEPPQYFAASAQGRLEEIRGSEYNTHRFDNSNTSDAFRPRFGLGNIEAGASSAPSTPEMPSSSFQSRSSQKIASEDDMSGEDTFKLNEGWGYRYRSYLTRVARQVRDHPPKTAQNQPGLYPQEAFHSSMSPLINPAQGHAQQPQQPQQQQQQQQNQQQQQQQQQQHGQHGNNGQNPAAQGLGGGQFPNIGPPFPLAPQHQQAAQGYHNNEQHANLNANVNINAGPHPAGGQQQGSVSNLNSQYSAGSEDAEDDGLWVHFVVKMGWSDRKRADEKAAN
ncbi:hypothetical protein BC939DRAFT_482599 [Gamsiella multidivaricata]|uniref:uncharacterized protein n=1 Tax=Gamsiella multidivaricata TaxID=101098 RepID=UPI0022210AA9|nr:uncharacterized protein BC939DRAFT_482599 [Gamsiella multidivaricata]KAI7815771.1 hypothetical protein BC939DRAFT_482599 [Gamsiella multidivaricata]